ncbi:MAG: methyltransferase [Tissierellia bacterium]|nr:methyltransferase [Tissierellia bacterium]
MMAIFLDFVPGTQYNIYQDRSKFSYGTDALLLSAFAKGEGKVIDLGTGTGIIPIRMINSPKVKEIVGVEIQSEIADMAIKSIKANNLDDRIDIVNEDIEKLVEIYGKHTFDTVITNPPYYEQGNMQNTDSNHRLSRHEGHLDLNSWIEIASKLLKYKGKFYMVQKPSRLVDIFYSMRNNKIEPKRILFVRHSESSRRTMVLIEGIKDGKPELIIEEDLVLFNGDTRTKQYENYYFLK